MAKHISTNAYVESVIQNTYSVMQGVDYHWI